MWANVTLFDRAARLLRLAGVRELTLEDPAVLEAAEFFGLRVAAHHSQGSGSGVSGVQLRLRPPRA
jgi:hypothetical protein